MEPPTNLPAVQPEQPKLPLAKLPLETELQTCLRRYKNDSLIAWHLGIPVEQVREARARYKPPKMRGEWISKTNQIDDNEFTKRQQQARRSNVDYLAAVQRMQLRG